jgi:sensor domain CHASE-containing protein
MSIEKILLAYFVLIGVTYVLSLVISNSNNERKKKKLRESITKNIEKMKDLN